MAASGQQRHFGDVASYPIYPKHPTSVRQRGTVAMWSRTPFRALWPDVGFSVEHAIRPLFDHLVSFYKKRLRQPEPECLGGFQVDHHFEFGRQLDWKFVCLCSPEYAMRST